MTNFNKVREFHVTYGVPVLAQPQIVAERVQLRLDMIDEERRELSEAIAAGDVVEVADALTDIAYLVYGTALEFGIDLDACFAEVHRANMSKLGPDGKPIYREDGKVLKGPNYIPPNIAAVLARATAPRDPTKLPARDLTDAELIAEQTRVEKLWDELNDEPAASGGHGGSPGEWMVERMDEIATEQARRSAAVAA